MLNVTFSVSFKHRDVLILTGMDVMSYLVYTESGYKCTLCGKITAQKHNGRRHMILKHTKPTNDVCKYCSKVFKHKYYLDEHIRSRECLSQLLFDAPPQSQ